MTDQEILEIINIIIAMEDCNGIRNDAWKTNEKEKKKKKTKK